MTIRITKKREIEQPAEVVLRVIGPFEHEYQDATPDDLRAACAAVGLVVVERGDGQHVTDRSLLFDDRDEWKARAEKAEHSARQDRKEDLEFEGRVGASVATALHAYEAIQRQLCPGENRVIVSVERLAKDLTTEKARAEKAEEEAKAIEFSLFTTEEARAEVAASLEVAETERDDLRTKLAEAEGQAAGAMGRAKFAEDEAAAVREERKRAVARAEAAESRLSALTAPVEGEPTLWLQVWNDLKLERYEDSLLGRIQRMYRLGVAHERARHDQKVKVGKATGLEQRYEVTRLNDHAGKHDDCDFFVLDLTHDSGAPSYPDCYAEQSRHAWPQRARCRSGRHPRRHAHGGGGVSGQRCDGKPHVPPAPPVCSWYDEDYDDLTDPSPMPRSCQKPATHWSCCYSLDPCVNVCEEHRCRCPQPDGTTRRQPDPRAAARAAGYAEGRAAERANAKVFRLVRRTKASLTTLERAVVEAAMAWHEPFAESKGPDEYVDTAPLETAMDEACAALRAKRGG